jgi:hypothetical protein
MSWSTEITDGVALLISHHTASVHYKSHFVSPASPL